VGVTDESKFASALAELQRIRRASIIEFDGAMDLLWKALGFIEEQIELERQKLDAYFPATGGELTLSMREARWRIESHNLFGVFPHMLSSGNLSALLSLLETYLFRICMILEPMSPRPLRDISGLGINRLYKFLDLVFLNLSMDLQLKDLDHYVEIEAASKIRNGLTHASGILQICRDPDLIRSIIANHLYLHERDRSEKITSDQRYIVRLSSGTYGEIKLLSAPFLSGDAVVIAEIFSQLFAANSFESFLV
jgi:hypothetical protein